MSCVLWDYTMKYMSCVIEENTIKYMSCVLWDYTIKYMSCVLWDYTIKYMSCVLWDYTCNNIHVLCTLREHNKIQRVFYKNRNGSIQLIFICCFWCGQCCSSFSVFYVLFFFVLCLVANVSLDNSFLIEF
jgi:hypothetical protein